MMNQLVFGELRHSKGFQPVKIHIHYLDRIGQWASIGSAPIGVLGIASYSGLPHSGSNRGFHPRVSLICTPISINMALHPVNISSLQLEKQFEPSFLKITPITKPPCRSRPWTHASFETSSVPKRSATFSPTRHM